MLGRRTFLAGATAMAGTAAAAETPKAIALPDGALFARDEDRYWAALRRQFLIPDGVVNLNNGTVGSSPRPVLKAVFDGYEQLEQMTMPQPEDYPIWGYGPWPEYRAPLARLMGAQVDQIAITRNATEANNYIANGFDMKAGDEVLISDEEHGSGEQPWRLREKRYGIVVRTFSIPKPAASPEAILDRIDAAIGPRTRILFVSHITTASGVVLPAARIAALARSRGVISAFDGAHVPGMMDVDLNAIGCDLYTGSMHKWLFAPKGTGFLYLRDAAVRERVWSTIVTGGYDSPGKAADRFMGIGSSAIPTLMGLNAAVAMAEGIGIERIEARGVKLADYLHGEMLKRGARSLTSPDATMRRAIVSVDIGPIDRMELETWLWGQHKVRVRGVGPNSLRLSTPYYLSRAEIDRFLSLYDTFRKGKGLA